MSKPVKDMIASEYLRRFEGVSGAVVVEIRGLDAKATTSMRGSLREKGIRVTVVKNALARRTFREGPLAALERALKGPSAMLHGAESVVDVAREIVRLAEDEKKIVLKGAVLDGEYFDGDAGVKLLGSFPTKAEAQAKVVTLVLSPARNLMGAAKGPGGRVLGVVKALQEKLENGETIAKIA
jgi:large subunit ribosomal protein L10